jgi:transcriptional regulator with XRE-family HTH domain
MNAFAKRLKSARKMKGWSLQDLADNAPISITKQALNKYEQKYHEAYWRGINSLGKGA